MKSGTKALVWLLAVGVALVPACTKAADCGPGDLAVESPEDRKSVV